MKTIISVVMLMLMTSLSWSNDIYVTQSGANLDLDITQDGANNTIGNSTTASASTGATTILDIDQVGGSNVIKYQINGATYTGAISLTGDSNDIDLNCDSTNGNSSCGTITANITMTGSSNDIDLDIGETSDAAGSTVDGQSAVLTITVNGDTNNYLIDIDGNGDSIGHTLIHSHTGSIADVDITQSGVNDNIINLTTSGDNHTIGIIQRD